jgi:hypothetical protein
VTKTARFGVAALVLVITAAVGAQEPKPALSVTATSPKVVQTSVKIQLVLSRYLGEKKLSSLPYLLWVTAASDLGRTDRTNLRMGVKIPVMSTVIAASGASPSYSYQDVGTNIDCTAQVIGDGTFKVNLTVSDTSIYFPDKDKGQAIPTSPSIPSFRSFTSNFSILLRDGQTAQYTTATDQVSGEVLKIDATLTVLK